MRRRALPALLVLAVVWSASLRLAISWKEPAERMPMPTGGPVNSAPR